MKGQEAFSRPPITKPEGFLPTQRLSGFIPPTLDTYSNCPSSFLPFLGGVLENADAWVETASDMAICAAVVLMHSNGLCNNHQPPSICSRQMVYIHFLIVAIKMLSIAEMGSPDQMISDNFKIKPMQKMLFPVPENTQIFDGFVASCSIKCGQGRSSFSRHFLRSMSIHVPVSDLQISLQLPQTSGFILYFSQGEKVILRFTFCWQLS